MTKGYTIFYEGSSVSAAEITIGFGSLEPLPPAVGQVFDTFELIAAPEVEQGLEGAAETPEDGDDDEGDDGGAEGVGDDDDDNDDEGDDGGAEGVGDDDDDEGEGDEDEDDGEDGAENT